jgi:hypothetical protein
MQQQSQGCRRVRPCNGWHGTISSIDFSNVSISRTIVHTGWQVSRSTSDTTPGCDSRVSNRFVQYPADIEYDCHLGYLISHGRRSCFFEVLLIASMAADTCTRVCQQLNNLHVLRKLFRGPATQARDITPLFRGLALRLAYYHSGGFLPKAGFFYSTFQPQMDTAAQQLRTENYALLFYVSLLF